MTIEIRQLRYAVATADAQSFSRAAAALRVKQSILSRRVMLLEERLGVKLFVGTTRGAEPTENGRVVIEQVARRLDITDFIRLQFECAVAWLPEVWQLNALPTIQVGLWPQLLGLRIACCSLSAAMIASITARTRGMCRVSL